MKIYLARHGQDEDNKNGILNGRRDMPLTELGESQAQYVAEEVKEREIQFDAVYTSPLHRAFRTAEIISKTTNNSEPIVEQKLIERDFGVLTGTPVAEIEERCAPDILKTDLVVYFLNPEGAETFPDLLKRADDLLKELSQKHSNDSILLVTHGDIGKMIYAQYYNVSWESVLKDFHFGNSELLLLSEDSPPEDTHIFSIKQHNH